VSQVVSTLSPGDVIGFAGRSLTSYLINLGTFGFPFFSLSHVGIIGNVGKRILLFESTTLCDLPCEVTGKKSSGAMAVDPETRFQTYRGRIYHYPLYRRLYPFERERLNNFLASHLGRPYDRSGAVRSGGLIFGAIEGTLREENLEQLFCSEYVAAALARVGIFYTDNASKWNPSKMVRTLRWRGVLKKPRRIK
jgi:hypothetical protein